MAQSLNLVARGRLHLTVPHEVRDELSMLQFAHMQALIPVLYLTIGIISFASAIAAQGEFPFRYQLGLPAILIVASAVRFTVWKRRRNYEVTVEQARHYLRGTLIVTVMLSLVGGLWAVAAYYETHETRRVLAAVFMTMSAFAATNCLASLPRAAIAAIVTGMTPIVLAMFFTQDVGIQAMALSIVVVAVLQIRLVLSKFSEMTSNLMLQREMRQLADTDALTGLANRRAFTAALSANTEQLKDGERLALVVLDLDGFKPANDRFGHAAGDAVLVGVAERLRSLCTMARCVARVGGDEFAIIMDAGSQSPGLEEFAETIRRMLSLPYVISGELISVSASVGVAVWPEDATSMSALLISADRALYADKASRSEVRQSAAG
jgi:diguanylate cyclase